MKKLETLTEEQSRAVTGGGKWAVVEIDGKLTLVWTEEITVNG